MKHNYHTHTYRCHHASGTEREYIETALRNGLGTLGFADHSPYIFPEGYYSSFRMFPEQTAGYYRTLGTLREEFKDSLEIRMGFEMEYYPRHFKETLAFMKEQEVTQAVEAAGLFVTEVTRQGEWVSVTARKG